jgi:predicted nucleic acid-binding protein
MKVCFDSSVLVAAVVDQLSNHESACGCFVRYSHGQHHGCCSTHALAECYATLTALPLPRKIQPAEARILIEENFIKRLEVLTLTAADYASALTRSSQLGLVSGIIYDALHLAVAERAKCQRIYTYNLAHFHRLQPVGITVTAP